MAKKREKDTPQHDYSSTGGTYQNPFWREKYLKSKVIRTLAGSYEVIKGSDVKAQGLQDTYGLLKGNDYVVYAFHRSTIIYAGTYKDCCLLVQSFV